MFCYFYKIVIIIFEYGLPNLLWNLYPQNAGPYPALFFWILTISFPYKHSSFQTIKYLKFNSKTIQPI